MFEDLKNLSEEELQKEKEKVLLDLEKLNLDMKLNGTTEYHLIEEDFLLATLTEIDMIIKYPGHSAYADFLD